MKIHVSNTALLLKLIYKQNINKIKGKATQNGIIYRLHHDSRRSVSVSLYPYITQKELSQRKKKSK